MMGYCDYCKVVYFDPHKEAELEDTMKARLGGYLIYCLVCQTDRHTRGVLSPFVPMS